MKIGRRFSKFLSLQRMTGPQQHVLRIVKQLREADLETIADGMNVSVDFVKGICQVLVQYNLLHQDPEGQFTLTRQGSKIQQIGIRSSTDHYKIQQVKNIIPQGNNMPQASGVIIDRPRLSAKGEIETEKDMDEDAKKHSIGEVIGEVKMSADLPSSEQVETALRSNPQSSYEEMKARLTSHTLICPAKGKEVPWHYCSACPHQKGMDLQRWTVQCSYEFNEYRLGMVYGREEIKALSSRGENEEVTDLDLEEFVALPHVKCPLHDRVTPVDRCIDCRYQRGGEWNYKSTKTGVVGWLFCGAPPFIEKSNDDSHTVEYGGKEWRAVPPRWR